MIICVVLVYNQILLILSVGGVGFAMLVIPGLYFLYRKASASLDRGRAE
jgi:hypothetical protein